MMHSLLLASIIGLRPQDPQISIDKAWEQEQKQRSDAAEILDDPKSSDSAVLKALQDLEKLIAYCRTPEIKALKNGEGVPMLYYQVNDILVQVICGYARLKDIAKVHQRTEELVANLTAPDTWVKGQMSGFYAIYADQLANDIYVSKLLPDPKLETLLDGLRQRSPYFIFSNLPYSTKSTDKLSTEEKVAGLSMIWSEAKYNFANFRLVPTLNWDAAYQSSLPKVIATKTVYEYYNVLREFIGNLHDSHTDVALPNNLVLKQELRPSLPIARIGNEVVVWLEPTEGFRKLGFRRGDVLRKIDGVEAIEYGQKTWAHRISSSTPQDADVRIYTYMLLRGPADRPLKLEVEHADGKVENITLDRRKQIPGVSLMPSEFKILPDGTVYFAFNTCANDAPSEAFAKALPEIRKAGRLIIDCRMNDGGSSNVGYSILSHLIDKDIQASKWETRTYRPSFRVWNEAVEWFGGTSSVNADKDRFDGPVAVLCGPRTFSAGEDFLAAYKMSKRGKLIGMPSGGSTGQPLSFQIPGGGWARVCTKHDSMADGTEFVGIGVQPDIKIWTNLSAIRSGKDPVLEAAIREVNK